jgi:hypothetical protein
VTSLKDGRKKKARHFRLGEQYMFTIDTFGLPWKRVWGHGDIFCTSAVSEPLKHCCDVSGSLTTPSRRLEPSKRIKDVGQRKPAKLQ